MFLFAGNRVAADLPVLNSSQVPKEIARDRTNKAILFGVASFKANKLFQDKL